MLLVEETAPAQGALPVAALRTHLRLGSGFDLIEDATEDAALAGFLRAAIATVEARTGKVLLTRVFRLRLEDCRRLIWREPDASSSELLHRWLVMDGAGLVRPLPEADGRLAAVDAWLLAQRSPYVDTLVVPPDALQACAASTAPIRRG